MAVGDKPGVARTPRFVLFASVTDSTDRRSRLPMRADARTARTRCDC